MNKVIVIVGQTATGKTTLSEKLALLLDGEIINGDALQVYKGLDILTAKIKGSEMSNVPHHLFSFKDINENYNVNEYQKNIRAVVDDVLARGKTPIVVGGTGLYIKAFLYDYDFVNEDKNDDLTNKYEHLSNEEIYEQLLKIDEKEALKIGKNNKRRLIRALVIYEISGKTKTELIDSQEHKMVYDASIYCLYLDKEELLDNISIRVDRMIEDGLIEEVKNTPTNSTAAKAIGYKEIKDYLDGNISLDEAKELIKIHTRQLAKRQLTWYKHQFDCKYIYNDENAIDKILEDYKK